MKLRCTFVNRDLIWLRFKLDTQTYNPTDSISTNSTQFISLHLLHVTFLLFHTKYIIKNLFGNTHLMLLRELMIWMLQFYFWPCHKLLCTQIRSLSLCEYSWAVIVCIFLDKRSRKKVVGLQTFRIYLNTNFNTFLVNKTNSSVIKSPCIPWNILSLISHLFLWS